jgi:hypothetical protein
MMGGDDDDGEAPSVETHTASINYMFQLMYTDTPSVIDVHSNK